MQEPLLTTVNKSIQLGNLNRNLRRLFRHFSLFSTLLFSTSHYPFATLLMLPNIVNSEVTLPTSTSSRVNNPNIRRGSVQMFYEKCTFRPILAGKFQIPSFFDSPLHFFNRDPRKIRNSIPVPKGYGKSQHILLPRVDFIATLPLVGAEIHTDPNVENYELLRRRSRTKNPRSCDTPRAREYSSAKRTKRKIPGNC